MCRRTVRSNAFIEWTSASSESRRVLGLPARLGIALFRLLNRNDRFKIVSAGADGRSDARALRRKNRMSIRQSGATILLGAFLAACLVTGSSHATPMPVLKGGAANANDITLVGQGPGSVGGRGGAGRGNAGHGSGGGIRHATIGRSGGKHGSRGGGGGGTRHATINRGGGKHASGGGKPRKHASSGPSKKYAHPRGHKPYSHYRNFPRYRYYGWYGGPFGYSPGGCAWLYRKAVATNSRYWWNRYRACAGRY